MARLSHLDEAGRARMVDVSHKPATAREAVAKGMIRVRSEVRDQAMAGESRKGDVIATAEIAGVMAAKRTSDLIPLCHPLALTSVKVAVAPVEDGFEVTARVRTTGPTGVEMEALTAVSVACLTLYDMLKSADKAMVIGDVRLIEKTGGTSSAV
jgi:cyclic pyranopterin monophosphate synthase